MKNYKLQLNENYSIRLKFPTFTNLKSLLLDIANLADRSMNYYFMLFVTLLFSGFIFSEQFQLGYLKFFYVSVLILLGLDLIRKIVAKGDLLPAVPYDVIILSITTVIAISLFTSTLASDIKYNIWGGSWLRTISGASLIAYWFFYFLFQLQVGSKELVRRILFLLSLSPLLAVILNIVLGNEPFFAIENFMQISGIGWLVLLVTQKEFKKFYSLNLLLSLAALYLSSSNEALTTNIIVLAFISVIYLVINYKQLGKKFDGLDKAVDQVITRKSSLKKLLKGNYFELLFVFSSLGSIVGLIWIRLSEKFDPLLPLRFGFDSFFDTTLLQFITGKGLLLYNGTLGTQIIHSFGIVAFTLFALLWIIVIRDLFRSYTAATKANSKGYVLFLMVMLVTLISNLILFGARDLDVIMIWVILALAGVNKSLMNDKQVYKLEKSIYIPSYFKDKKKIWHSIQLVSILLVIIGVFFAVIQLGEINSFLI